MCCFCPLIFLLFVFSTHNGAVPTNPPEFFVKHSSPHRWRCCHITQREGHGLHLHISDRINSRKIHDQVKGGGGAKEVEIKPMQNSTRKKENSKKFGKFRVFRKLAFGPKIELFGPKIKLLKNQDSKFWSKKFDLGKKK